MDRKQDRSEDARSQAGAPESARNPARQDGPIEDRLMKGGQDSQRDIEDAAQEAFVQDQEDPEHPTRIERRHGAEDPSHSRGSEA